MVRRQPGGQRPGVVFDQHADEAFQGSQDGPVQHHGRAALVLGVDVFGPQARGHGKVHLDGAALPMAADGVLQGVFDLRTVEGALSFRDFVVAVGQVQAVLQGLLGLVPDLVGADALFGAGGDLVQDLGEAEVGVDLLQQAREGGALFLELVFRAEDVPIVLGEAAHAHHAVQRTGGLVAVALAEFAVAQRQFAVGVQAGVEDLHVARTVHGLQAVHAVLGLRREHVFLVIVPVAGLLPQGQVQDLRRLDFLVAVVLVHLAHVLLDLLPDRPALGVPEDQARRLVLEVEQVQLAADAAVVAQFGLLEHVQVGVLVFLAGPGGAVDALQHFIVAVAAPVGPGDLHQLEHSQAAGGRHVRAAAQVDEVALAVQADLFVGGDRGDDLGLVGLADAAEELHGLVPVPFLARHGFVAARQFGHLLFDGFQVFRREGPLVREIVVETVVDDRADGDLGVGKQGLDRVGQQVRRGVPDQVQAFGVLVGDDAQGRIPVDHVAGIHQARRFAIHGQPAGQRRLAQPGPDGARDLVHGNGMVEFAPRTVGKGDANHLSVS
ncbi:hypothetical protein CDEN61S_00385 [Castellaniella denitrificans]